MAEIAGSNALLVDPLDEVAISEAMMILLGEPDQREEFARKGRIRANEFTWAKCVETHVAQFLITSST
ncbi:hypothetical protein N185_08675 [Sinorhizobium sp. GW3]|nr:hypothetical protein N185_08675 [Sinorhizobium sp. GW3]